MPMAQSYTLASPHASVCDLGACWSFCSWCCLLVFILCIFPQDSESSLHHTRKQKLGILGHLFHRKESNPCCTRFRLYLILDIGLKLYLLISKILSYEFLPTCLFSSVGRHTGRLHLLKKTLSVPLFVLVL